MDKNVLVFLSGWYTGRVDAEVVRAGPFGDFLIVVVGGGGFRCHCGLDFLFQDQGGDGQTNDRHHKLTHHHSARLFTPEPSPTHGETVA